jgi:hypothetical protein
MKKLASCLIALTLLFSGAAPAFSAEHAKPKTKKHSPYKKQRHARPKKKHVVPKPAPKTTSMAVQASVAV